MPDYVYALHDFLPEHEDEVSFRAGERIEVVEKDDLYGDGWWQVSLISLCSAASCSVVHGPGNCKSAVAFTLEMGLCAGVASW
jgi:hypothetical protein